MSEPPQFPEAMGHILGDLLRPTPLAGQDGPPWTHTFNLVEGEPDGYGEDGEPYWLTKPTHAIERRPPVGAVLTSNDPEPGHGVAVLDDCGSQWRRTDSGDHDGAANWEQVGVDWFEPESWTKVAGNYGPVTVVDVDAS
jgi:hypothetical protein